MSRLIRLSDGEYPLDTRQLGRLVPQVSLPGEPSDEQLARHGFAKVRETRKPDAQPGERVVEEPPERDEDGVWRQRWRVVQPTQEQIDAEKARATVRVDQLMRERMIQEMALPGPIQRDLDAVLEQIDGAENIAEVRAVIAGMRPDADRRG